MVVSSTGLLFLTPFVDEVRDIFDLRLSYCKGTPFSIILGGPT